MSQPTHYFCYVGHSTGAKNNLHREFQNYLISTGGTLVESENLPALQKQILDTADALNKKHSRCQPLVLKFWNSHKDQIGISGFYCQIFQIIPATLIKL